MSKQTSGREARVGILPDTPRKRDVAMFDGFMKNPLWANIYRQELAKESGKPIIQMLMDENYREPVDSKLKSVVVPGQEYDSKHGITIVKSIVEGVNYRYDDGSSSKDLIKHLKLLPRSVKEAAVRTNHFGKDFIRQNISKVTHDHHSLPASPSAASPAGHSHHLRTTYAYDSPSKHATKTPAPSSPSQLDPFIALIPPHRQTQALEAAQLFNSSAHQTSSFSSRARTTLPPPTHPVMAASLASDSRPITGCGKLTEEASTRGPGASKAELRIAEDKRTEMLFKRLTQENPGILEKIKNMYIARNFTKQGASGYQPRKENYMQMSNTDAIEMLRKKIAQKLHSGPGELRRSFELFDRDGSGKVDIAELSEVLGMFNINLPPDQVFSLMCQFGASDGELDFNTFIGTVLAPVKVIETQKLARKDVKLKNKSFLVGKNWINMHNDQVIAYLKQRVYQLYGFQGITFTLNVLFRHFANDCPLMSGPELHEVLRCFGVDVPLEQCADIIRDFMRDHKDFASGGLDHAEFVRFVLELDNPDEFKHFGAGVIVCRGLRLTHNDDEKHLARLEQLKIIREKKNADAAGDIAVLVAACRKDASNISKIEKLMRMKDVGRSGTINLRHFIDIITESFEGDVSVTNARRLAGIFDENMVGYVSYEMLLDKIRQQLASATYDAASLPATPGSWSPEPRVDLIKAEFGEEKRMRELSDKIRLKIAGKIRNGSSEFRKAFEMLDRDGSGAIAFDELSHVVQRILGISIPEKVAVKLFQAIDKNKNGQVSFTEFSRFFDPASGVASSSPALPSTPSVVDIRPFASVAMRPKTSAGCAVSPFTERKAELDKLARLKTPASRARTPLF